MAHNRRSSKEKNEKENKQIRQQTSHDSDAPASKDSLITDDSDNDMDTELETLTIPRNRIITVSIPLGNRPVYLKLVRSQSSSVSPTSQNYKYNEEKSGTHSQLWHVCWNIPFLLLLYYLFMSHRTTLSSNFCNMTNVQYRDFNQYYGISPSKNHFTVHLDNVCDSNIVFKSVLPPTVGNSHNSPTSFMLLSKYGTGKTTLRCLYLSSLQSSDYLKVLVSNQQANAYLRIYVSESSTNEKSLFGWSENEFTQMILSLSVTQFVNTFENERFKLPNMSLDEKFGLLTIICYYYNDQSINKLEILVNAFLEKSADDTYTVKKAESQIFERNNYRDKPLLMHFKRDLKKLNTIAKDPKKLELLLGVMEGEDYQNTAIDKIIFDNVFQSLTEFTSFMKNDLKKPVVFVIDGIDENQYFFLDGEVDKVSLELFYRSSLSPEILASVMGQNFYLALFYLEIDGINITDAILRKDKFPVYTIDWSSKLLIDYADYVLSEINQNASTSRCQLLPDFKKLVNYTDEAIRNIIEQIQTPKELQLFMVELIREMNKCANDVHEPFIATYDNVKKAFEKSVKSSYS